MSRQSALRRTLVAIALTMGTAADGDAQMQPSGSAALRASPSSVPLLTPGPANRDALHRQQVVVAARRIAPRTVITTNDVEMQARPAGGDFATDMAEVVGRESRAAMPAGRALRPDDLAPLAIIERNERVALLYTRGALSISTEGIALERAARGRRLRVMNLSSRRTVMGVAKGQGEVEVTK